MTVFDYTVLIIIGFSIVVSMMRGAVKSLLAILGWIVAFYVAKTYLPLLTPLLPENIPGESLKTLAAFLILLISVLFINALLTVAISALVEKINLGWLNRFLGAVFGLLKGLLIVCVLVLLSSLTSLPKEKMWTDAMLSAPLEVLIEAVLPWLPEAVSKHVKFD